jgi:hypothetical protein
MIKCYIFVLSDCSVSCGLADFPLINSLREINPSTTLPSQPESTGFFSLLDLTCRVSRCQIVFQV